MKRMNFWGLILVGLMCIGFTACGGDDESEEIINQKDKDPISRLLGTWEITEMIGGDQVTTTLIFNSDGTYSETSRIGSTITASARGKFSYNTSTNFLTTVPSTGRSWTYIVVDVSDISLVLIFSDYSGSITYSRKA